MRVGSGRGDDAARVRRLAARAARGDGAAFAELVRRHDEQLRGLAYHLLEDRDLMDDVMQEAYLRAFRGLPRFRGGSSVATWLHRLTYNACMDELRRAGRRPSRAPLDEVDDQRSPAAEPGAVVVRRAELRAALTALPPGERAAVWLVDAAGFDYAAAGRVLDVPEGTVASRLARARPALRTALTRAEEAPR